LYVSCAESFDDSSTCVEAARRAWTAPRRAPRQPSTQAIKWPILASISRKLGVSITLFWGRWFLPLPNKVKLTYQNRVWKMP